MSTIKDRVQLLLELIKKNGTEDIELFNLLVPTYDIQLYYLYNILEDSEILEDCKFKPPVIDEELLNITIQLPRKNIKKCLKYLQSVDFTVQYLEKKTCKLVVANNDKLLSITFIKI